MTPAQYLQALAKIETERQSKIKSLNDVWALVHDGKPTPKPIGNHAEAVTEVRGAWRQVVDKAIEAMPRHREFTIRDVTAALGIEVDQAALSGYLKMLSDRSKIELIEPGRGRRATVYKTK